MSRSRKRKSRTDTPASGRASKNRRGLALDPWKEVYLVGTEWENYDSVYDVDWDFSHLDESIASGDIAKYSAKHPVYLFGSTEPQMVQLDPENPDSATVVYIPVIIAIHCAVPPPSVIGLASVQREEELIPMRSLKMDWVPHVSPSTAGRVNPSKLKPSLFFLKCSQRREGLKQLKEEQLIRFQYALPYVFVPRLQQKAHYETEVKVMVELEEKAFPPFDFDWEMDDDVEEFVDDLMKTHEVHSRHRPVLLDAIAAAVAEKKAEIRADKLKRRAAVEELSEEERTALNNLKTYKYYPRNAVPDISSLQTRYVNRYYGQAEAMYGREIPKQQAAAPAFVFKKIC